MVKNRGIGKPRREVWVDIYGRKVGRMRYDSQKRCRCSDKTDEELIELRLGG